MKWYTTSMILHLDLTRLFHRHIFGFVGLTYFASRASPASFASIYYHSLCTRCRFLIETRGRLLEHVAQACLHDVFMDVLGHHTMDDADHFFQMMWVDPVGAQLTEVHVDEDGAYFSVSLHQARKIGLLFKYGSRIQAHEVVEIVGFDVESALRVSQRCMCPIVTFRDSAAVQKLSKLLTEWGSNMWWRWVEEIVGRLCGGCHVELWWIIICHHPCSII